MDKNIFFKMCCNIDYNTYRKLQIASCLSTLGLAVTNELISSTPVATNSMNALAYTTGAAFLMMTFTKGREHTKDIAQIKELYNCFLNNYNKLNKIFDLNNPVEIYTMFNYLLNNGYLSRNKEFQKSDSQSRDVRGLLGAEVVTGQAVCRHISGMLTDILNVKGIESSQLGVYLKTICFGVNFLKEPKYTVDELIEWVETNNLIDQKAYEFAMDVIAELVIVQNQGVEFSAEFIDDKNILARIIGNHAITFAYKDGKKYFLDPTQSRIYRMDDLKGTLYDSKYNDIQMHFLSSIALNGPLFYPKIKKRLSESNSNILEEEEEQMVKATLEKCENNMDVFEQFYTDNSQLYDDISDKILSIKKLKIHK